ncbi:MAG: molybdopterin-dependent oxidoreductase [Rhodospirillaceae bacterium]|nr:molybdopterin-dependent oxidoreductase [Rhodospirillaceae bacterium]MBT4116108.1 molybdopterin-dependent oxidoreductase [Rhodospirillaceae bacterium]MBT4674714.1 molybdopterin-dependent oxidoreductase [Rhodospirillaceae bacterium]MBT4720081.1 molybdopterin-dependent oxidoreductase [Rhodospirillaceae bacterium]MBT4751543.1 molybdopterin-dependent oxidoreductase [Rhodospirillaceae bacterium]
MNIIDPKFGTLEAEEKAPHEDNTWVSSSCALCYGSCSIKAHRVDGVIVKIEGNPDSVVGKGRLCGKGVSGIMSHYDPNRVTKPLRRTNPEKGIGVDPKWKEVSWDEALDEIAAELVRIRAEDPRKLLLQRTTTVTASRLPFQAFAAGFGTPNHSTGGGGLHCGNGAHLISGIMHASWGVLPDFQYCNYAIYFGASKGHSAGHASTSNMGMAADARARGMKMVVVDPMCNFAAAKASEWVPIRVGTDGALALAMCNVLVNDLGVIDAPYLKAKTNGPYLTGPDKRYMRDAFTGKPLVWDERAGGARPFDESDPADMALEGTFSVDGTACRPSFDRLKEHFLQFTPEWAEEITTVPAANIRRITKEFADEARVGSTIVIDGVTVPYRPVAAIAFRGSQGHKNSVYNFLAVDLLNQMVGAADVAGSCLGFNPTCHGHPDTGQPWYEPNADPDGLMITGMWMGYHYPYPVGAPRLPQNIGLQDLFVMSMTSPFLDSTDREKLWDDMDLPYRPEMIINYGSNLLMSIANKDVVAESLKTYKMIVSFDVLLTETSEFADIVLPDCDYLQSKDSRSNFPFIFSLPAGMGEWCWPIRQPVAEPQGEQRPMAEVMLELADRVGFRADLNAGYNGAINLRPPYRLEGDKKYTYEEICDHDLKNNFGPEHGWEWFKEHGLIKWDKKPEEVYWRAFVDVRVPIYWEWMIDTHKEIAAIAEPRGLQIPEEYYDPMATWLPCLSHEEHGEGFDFYAFYYRDIIHTNSYTMENPWLDEAARLDPFSYNIAINTESGRAQGLADGDAIAVETSTGRRVEGRVKLTEAIHPEGLGIAALAGHWVDTMPIAKGKGVFFNELLELDYEHASPVNLNLDLCAKVKITRLEAAS